MTTVQERKNRETGTVIIVNDRGLDDFEREAAREQGYEWNRWETICVDHGTVCSHLTRALAVSFSAAPLQWCEDCQKAQEVPARSRWIETPGGVAEALNRYDRIYNKESK